ncbi:MAG: hypothetical protein ACD_75C00320G0002 [uncultured bacterium]|nr:MAG: hypothetical protein ACD_75C00320G0002 [uncultured bacterium]
MNVRPPLISVGILSASLLAYEILLMHLFAIIQFHHFAYMIIGLALLGYGLSGTFLAVSRERMEKNYAGFYLLWTALFSLTATFSFFLAQAVPFNGLELFWDPTQILFLAVLFILILIPFFCGATAIGMTLAVCRKSVAVIYGADLVGAGLGSILVIVLLFWIFPARMLVVISGMGCLAAASAILELRLARAGIKMLLLGGIFIMVAVVGVNHTLQPTPYKTLEQYLQIAGTRIVDEQASPLGLLQVLESDKVPLRYAPGVSLVSLQEPPEQKGVFINGEGLSVITRAPEDLRQLGYLDQMTSALPYHLRVPDKVLILGVGGGQDILQAKYHGVHSITGVELNPQMVRLLTGKYAQFSGNLLGAGIAVHIGDMRGFMEGSRERFDLVHLALVDAFSPSAAGLYALSEEYLYTVEAMQEYIRHLSPQGYLAITRWIKNPPRDSLKLMATAVAALHKAGIGDVRRHLALIRGWQTSTLLVKSSEFSQEEIGRIEAFCQARSFDIAYTFATGEDQANRYNIQSEPLFFQAARALVGEESAAFIEGYKYNLQPAIDDRPYFHHFFRWSALREVLQLKAMGGAALLEAGYLILLAVLVVAVFLSFLLIMMPLFLFRRHSLGQSWPISKRRVFLYFFAIGIGYLFIEIAFIQKFVLFLHHPVYSISASVAAFLVSSGIGSLSVQQWGAHLPAQKLIRVVVAGIALISLCYLFWLGKWFTLAADLPFSGRLVLTAMFIAPLGFLMGMPFPLALASLATHAAGLMPWAWGINGCGSVISSMLATFLAIHCGFKGVIVAAVLLYAAIAFCFPSPKEDGSGPDRP